MPVPVFVWLLLTGVVLLGAGATVGAAATDNSEEVRRYKKAAAKATAQTQAARDKLKKAATKFREYGRFEEFLVALVAVGFGVAYADGEIAESEEQEIEEFLLGVTRSALPQRVKDQIERLRRHPPKFNESMEYMRQIENNPAFDRSVFDDIIQITMKADGKIHPGERAYLAAWKERMKKTE
ncbi:MAG: TerB family tellurite resistance protein [Gemmatimonadetes bacterium]|nr:TerB family tellurite resistance protein [Gemmatimonadota bacterium]